MKFIVFFLILSVFVFEANCGFYDELFNSEKNLKNSDFSLGHISKIKQNGKLYFKTNKIIPPKDNLIKNTVLPFGNAFYPGRDIIFQKILEAHENLRFNFFETKELSILFFDLTYQLLYYKIGSNYLAKKYYTEKNLLNEISDFDFMTPINIKEFLNLIPKNLEESISPFSFDKELLDLTQRFLLSDYVEAIEHVDFIFEEVLSLLDSSYIDEQLKKILNSFITAKDDFIKIFVFLLPNSMNGHINLSLKSSKGFEYHKKFMNEYNFDEVISIFGSPIIQFLQIQRPDPDTKMKVFYFNNDDERVSHLKVNYQLKENEILGRIISLNPFSNQKLVMYGGITEDRSENSYLKIKINLKKLNLTETKIEFCDSINCSDLQVEDSRLAIRNNLESRVKIYFKNLNFNFLNLIKLAFMNNNNDQISPQTYQYLSTYQDSNYNIEIRSLIKYFDILVEHDRKSENFSKILDDYVNVRATLNKNKKKSENPKIRKLRKLLTILSFAIENKKILLSNMDLILDQSKKQVNKDLISIRKSYLKI